MSGILSVIETKNNDVKNSSLELLSESQKISSEKNLENNVIIMGELDEKNLNKLNHTKMQY